MRKKWRRRSRFPRASPRAVPQAGQQHCRDRARADAPTETEQLACILTKSFAEAQAQQLAFTLKNTEQQGTTSATFEKLRIQTARQKPAQPDKGVKIQVTPHSLAKARKPRGAAQALRHTAIPTEKEASRGSSSPRGRRAAMAQGWRPWRGKHIALEHQRG